jgi:hypothetical protein
MPVNWPVGVGNKTWHVSYGIFKGPGSVCIPIDQLEGMSAEQIGWAVLDLLEEARSAEAFEIASHCMFQHAFDGMPSDTLFEWHKILYKHRNQHEHLADALLAVSEEIYQRSAGVIKRARQRKRKKLSGFVYLLQSGPYYKIGVSTQVDERIKQLSTQPPFDIELLHTIQTDDMYGLEKKLHADYDSKRKNGEWFELDQADVEYIKGLGQ